MEITETVTISKKVYEALLDEALLMNCLRNAGVDSTDVYEYALDQYLEQRSESRGD